MSAQPRVVQDSRLFCKRCYSNVLAMYIADEAPESMVIFTGIHMGAFRTHCVPGNAGREHDHIAPVDMIGHDAGYWPDGPVVSSDRSVRYL